MSFYEIFDDELQKLNEPFISDPMSYFSPYPYTYFEFLDSYLKETNKTINDICDLPDMNESHFGFVDMDFLEDRSKDFLFQKLKDDDSFFKKNVHLFHLDYEEQPIHGFALDGKISYLQSINTSPESMKKVFNFYKDNSSLSYEYDFFDLMDSYSGSVEPACAVELENRLKTVPVVVKKKFYDLDYGSQHRYDNFLASKWFSELFSLEKVVIPTPEHSPSFRASLTKSYVSGCKTYSFSRKFSLDKDRVENLFELLGDGEVFSTGLLKYVLGDISISFNYHNKLVDSWFGTDIHALPTVASFLDEMVARENMFNELENEPKFAETSKNIFLNSQLFPNDEKLEEAYELYPLNELIFRYVTSCLPKFDNVAELKRNFYSFADSLQKKSSHKSLYDDLKVQLLSNLK